MDPAIERDVPTGQRYNAARNAALASSPADSSSAAARQALQKQAIDWLRADLVFWTEYIRGSDAALRQLAVETLRHWQRDRDLTAIRDQARIAALPDSEQPPLAQLWEDVAELLIGAEN